MYAGSEGVHKGKFRIPPTSVCAPDLVLTMTRIGKNRTDARRPYVEQATASSLDKPYRQRVYRVRQVDDTTVESAVYVNGVPLTKTTLWRRPHRASAVRSAMPLARNGAVRLEVVCDYGGAIVKDVPQLTAHQ